MHTAAGDPLGQFFKDALYFSGPQNYGRSKAMLEVSMAFRVPMSISR